MTAIDIDGMTKRFVDLTAVNDLHLPVREKEIFVLAPGLDLMAERNLEQSFFRWPSNETYAT